MPRYVHAPTLAFAALLLAAAGLGCEESPMAYSPDGRQLAFTTVEPITDKEATYHLAGGPTYRLFVLSERKKLRVLEATRKWQLSGPTFSRDGKRLLYLRIPLLTAKEMAKLAKAMDEWLKKKKSTTTRPATPAEMPAVATQQAQLITRAVESSNVVSTIPLELPVYPMTPYTGEEGGDSVIRWDYYMSYILTRPQLDRKGRLHFGTRLGAWSVEVKTGKLRKRGAAFASRLSPDGKTLAMLGRDEVILLPTDGGKAVTRKCKGVAPKGFAWLDASTLVLTAPDEDSDGAMTLYFLKPDGKLARKLALTHIREHTRGQSTVDLAIAPNGRNMVLSLGSHVFFMNVDGKVIKRFSLDDKQALVLEPTFSPDSKTVACKHMLQVGKGERRTAAILFFSAEGKGLATVDVPAVKSAGR